MESNNNIATILDIDVDTIINAQLVEGIRPLVGSDLEVAETTAVGSISRPLVKIRAAHHNLAKLIALGKKPSECSAITGYCLSRISVLQGDPAFAELVAHYGEQVEEQFVNVVERLAIAATTTAEVIQDRLEEDPESFSAKDLTDLLKATADRAGYSPVQKSESVVTVASAADIAAIKKEVQLASNGKIKTIEAEILPSGDEPEDSGDL